MSEAPQRRQVRKSWGTQERIAFRTDRAAEAAACWKWRGSHTKSGYATMRWKGKLVRVSRMIANTPDGLCALHRCDNPGCVNPAHIFNGTNLTNVVDRDRKGRQAKGERIGVSVLSEAQVREIRSKYVPRKYSRRRLALEYGVSHGAIWYVTTGKNWKHVA